MSHAGSDHAERVLRHAIAGVEGVYDRHAYKDEKRLAVAALADLVGRILRENNVIPLREKNL